MTMPHKRVFEVPKEIYPFSDHWVEIDDITLHYVDEGQGAVILFFMVILPGLSFIEALCILHAAYQRFVLQIQ